MIGGRAVLLAALWPALATAQVLEFPGNASLTLEEAEQAGRYVVPVEPYAHGFDNAIPVDGFVTRQAWRIEARGLSTDQILGPLRRQLEAQGFVPLLDCVAEGCGGFDFRYAIRVIRPPEMYVDLGDFRFLSAIRASDAGDEAIGLLVSRSAHAGFVQVTRVAPQGSETPVAVADAAPVRAATSLPQGDFAARLEAEGHVVLPDLSFATGSAQLDEGPHESLAALADYLRSNPQRTVALVGHTDAEGSLEGNIALSRRRAASVLERMVSVHGIPRRQMEAQGMGYLAPVASNLTQAGRDANRRVEVIVTSTD